MTALLGSWPGGGPSFKVGIFSLLHFLGPSFQVFIFDSFAWELAWGGPKFQGMFFLLLHFWGPSFQAFIFDSFAWELAWGRPKFQGRNFFHCCIFGGPVSRFSFLTALLGSWPGGGPSFKVVIFSTAAFFGVQFPGFHF